MDKKNIGLGLLILIVLISVFVIDKSLVTGYVTAANAYLTTEEKAESTNTGAKSCEISLENLPPLPAFDFSDESFAVFLDKIKPYEQYIRESGDFYGIEPELIRAIMRVESNGNIHTQKKYIGKNGQTISMKTLCNGKCKMCNFCGGEGDSELCKEKDNTCFYLSDGALEISESCGYCSLMATSPKKCENAKGCDIDGYLSGKPEDSIFAGAYELRAVVDSYNKFVESEAKELPAYNIYWATALGYNAGVGSMKLVLKKLTEIKYAGDYSKFKWWEINVDDFNKIKSVWIELSAGVGNKPSENLLGYPLTVMKALNVQNFKGCGGVLQGGQQVNPLFTTKNTIQIDVPDNFVYQVNPSFSADLTDNLNVYADLREEAFIIAKDVERCYEEKKLNVDGIQKSVWDICVNQIIEESKNDIYESFGLSISVCDKDNETPVYVICAVSDKKVSVYNNDIFSETNLVYKFALGFGNS
ncbi:transglycosylase SLT domain-containing protein [Candidatus Woesearchaeota archaeon]|nr:transglycosylase SLT domain-containing protein [Candidatus Woesearchaeota archaeon]